jgi:hypothetical protein
MTVNLPTNWKMRIGVVVLCASIVSLSRPGLAADEKAGAPSAAQVDQSIESLLRLVEQKIVTDHTSSPAGDSAIDVWKQVIHVIPVTDAVRVGNALTTFAIHMRRRASEEQKAGNTTVSEDMSVFATQAEGLKSHSAGSGTAAAVNVPRPEVQPPKYEPLAGSMPPITPPPQQPAAQSSVAEFYAWRGDLMLAKKDVPGARKYYELAASAGSARAAMQLSRINDPGFAAPPNAEPEAPAPSHPHPHRRRARTTEVPLGVGRIY